MVRAALMTAEEINLENLDVKSERHEDTSTTAINSPSWSKIGAAVHES